MVKRNSTACPSRSKREGQRVLAKRPPSRAASFRHTLTCVDPHTVRSAPPLRSGGRSHLAVKQGRRVKQLLLAFLLCSSAYAQSPSPSPPSSPADAAPQPPKTLFDYRQELQLSDQQIATMQSELKQLGLSAEASRKRIGQLEAEYQQLLAKNSPLPPIKAKLQQIANATALMRYNDLAASRHIMGNLSAAQLKAWREIQIRSRPVTP